MAQTRFDRASRTSRRRPASFRCLPGLRAALGLTIAYAVGMMAQQMLALPVSPALFTWWWAFVLAGLGMALTCLYRYQPKAWRWGAVAALLLGTAMLTVLSPTLSGTLAALQALGLGGFSLVLYDLGRLSGRNLQTPGGLIFLGVVAAYVLHTPLTDFIGLALLALGSTLALRQLL